MGDLNGVIQAVLELCIAGFVGFIFFMIKYNELDDEKNGKYLKAMYILGFVMLVLEAVAYMVRHSEAGFAAFFVKMSQFAIYEASFVMGIMYYYYLKASLPYVKENEKLLKISSYILYTVLYIGAFMEIVNLFAGSMYSFDASNRIQRGTLFFIYPLVIALANLIDFVVLLRYKEEITRRKFWVLSSYVFLPILAAVLQFFSYGIAIGTMSVIAALIINYLYIVHGDELDDDDEISDDMIPFELEKAHVENYVEIEQERLGDKIQVDWDVKVLDFKLPPLSLQILVENAIKHGISKKTEGGLVVIKTEEKIGEVVVSVADDGRGFDTRLLERDDVVPNSAHIGLIDIERNVRLGCNGTFEIKSTPNVGTLAKIHIPR